MFPNLRLRAGPRARLPAPNTSAASPPLADALVPDSAGSGTAGTLYRAHWPANPGSPANAATASLPADSRRCNNVLAAAAAETSTRSPSRHIGDAGAGDAGLDRSQPRRDTAFGPRELFTPARSSLGAELLTPLRGAFADSSPPTHAPAEPVVSLSPSLPSSSRHAPLLACASRRHAPGAPSPPCAFPAINSWRPGACGAAKVAPYLAASDILGPWTH